MELYNELQSKTQFLERSIKQLRKSGTDYADAEKRTRSSSDKSA